MAIIHFLRVHCKCVLCAVVHACNMTIAQCRFQYGIGVRVKRNHAKFVAI